MPLTDAELIKLRNLLKDRLQLHNKALTNDYQDKINELLLKAAFVAIDEIVDQRAMNVTNLSS